MIYALIAIAFGLIVSAYLAGLCVKAYEKADRALEAFFELTAIIKAVFKEEAEA